MSNLFLLLSSHLDPLNTVGGLDVDLDLFPGQSLDLDQHLAHTTDTGMEYVTILQSSGSAKKFD